VPIVFLMGIVGICPQASGQTAAQASQDITHELLAIQNRLTNIRDLYHQLQEPAAHNVNHNYDIVEQMQVECDQAEEQFTWRLTPSEASQALDDIVRVHMLMACAAVTIDDSMLFELHTETACRRVRQYRGYEEGRCHEAVAALLEGYLTSTGPSLQSEYSRRKDEYTAAQNKWLKVKFTFDRSTAFLQLKDFAIRALPDPGNTSPRDDAQLFAAALDKRLNQPIVKNWFFTKYEAEARSRKLNLEPADFIKVSGRNVEIQQWEKEITARFAQENPIEMEMAIPDGRYYVYRRERGVSDPEPNLVVDRTMGPVPDGFLLKMAESATYVDVVPHYIQTVIQGPVLQGPLKPSYLGALRPRFELLDFRLGTSKQTRDLEGSFGGRMFQQFGQHLALQTQGQLEFRNYSDRLDLDQPLLKLAGQNPFPREQRGFTNYSSREFQLDVGPVLRFGNAQFAAMQSLRYVTRGDFDQGGILGQFFFNAGYLFKNWGQIGVFGTKANLDQPVVKSVQFNQVFFEETYLKVADQLGLNFQISLPKQAGYLEGALGYLNTTWAGGAAGGTLRYVTPWPSNKCSLTAEVGYNEGFVRSGENPLRVGFGMRLGNWSQPSNLRNETGPVPVIVPAIRYETLTRIARRGNNKPQANAGPDINNVDPGALVTLDGRGSFDPDSDPITYKWIRVSGPSVTLANPGSATPSFQAGNFGDNYVFKLITCDNFGLCSDDANSTACPGSGTSTDACVSVTVRKAPQIASFSATPAQIDAGQCSTLNWETTDADHVTLAPGIGEVPIKGSMSVCPATTTTYTLTAYSGTFSVSREVVVSIGSAQIVTFTATPTQIDVGKCSTLSWKVQSAVRVTIEPGLGEVPLEGSRSVCPTATATYTLTAFSSDNKAATQDVQVTVASPKALSFTADASDLCPSNCTTLRWSTSSAVRVVISPDIGEVPLQGSRQVCPTSTTTYTLTAFAASPGQATTASVQVTIKPLPTITIFSANKTSISAPDSVQLSWKTEGANTVILTPPGQGVSPSGSMVVAPTSTQRYDLTAKNACSQVTQSITIYVKTPLPGILSFTAIPPQCLKGQCSQLNWQVSNTQSVSLTNDGTGEVKNVTGQSALQVCPQESTTYTLRACNSAGECVSADAMVTVIVQGPPSILTFEANPPEISAGATSILSWVIGGAEQVTLINTGDGTSTPVASVVSSWPVSPKNTTVYTLVAVNRFAASVIASVTVTVK
jgi:hypothetical protein